MTDDHETLEYALGDGEKPRVGMRRDGVGSPSHFKRWIGTFPYEKITRMGDVWKDMPMFFEFFASVKMMRGWGWDIPYSLKWVLKNHASLVNEGPLGPDQIAEGSSEEKLLRDIDLYAGARLVPEKARVECEDGVIKVRVEGTNKGVSKIYLPYEFVYEFKRPRGKCCRRKNFREESGVDTARQVCFVGRVQGGFKGWRNVFSFCLGCATFKKFLKIFGLRPKILQRTARSTWAI